MVAQLCAGPCGHRMGREMREGCAILVRVQYGRAAICWPLRLQYEMEIAAGACDSGEREDGRKMEGGREGGGREEGGVGGDAGHRLFKTRTQPRRRVGKKEFGFCLILEFWGAGTRKIKFPK